MNCRPPRPERGALTRLRYAPIANIIIGFDLRDNNYELKRLFIRESLKERSPSSENLSLGEDRNAAGGLKRGFAPLQKKYPLPLIKGKGIGLPKIR